MIFVPDFDDLNGEFTMTGNLEILDGIPKSKDLHLPVFIIGSRYDEARPETLACVVSQRPQSCLSLMNSVLMLSF